VRALQNAFNLQQSGPGRKGGGPGPSPGSSRLGTVITSGLTSGRPPGWVVQGLGMVMGGWADRAAFKMIKVAACRDSESPTKRRKFQLNVKAKQILTLLALRPKVHTGICSLHIEMS